MEKKRSVITSILLAISTLTFGQIDTYDLSKFKLPELKSQRLNLNSVISNTNALINSTSSYFPGVNRREFEGAGVVGGGYNLFYNSNRIQSTSEISSNFNFINLSEKRLVENQGTYYENENRMQTNLEFQNSTNYYVTGKTFVFVSPYLSYNFQNFMQSDKFENTSGETEGDFELKNTTQGFNATTNLGLGWGRIEKVNDAQMALYILKDLKKENRLKREPTHDEIAELAELIAIKKSESILDSRQRIIEEVKAIDSLLNGMGLTNETDATYFTTIYDNWMYANNPDRYSGFSLSISSNFGFTSNLSEVNIETSEEKYKRYSPFYGIAADLRYTKPINHKWQQNWLAGFFISKIKTRTHIDFDPVVEEDELFSNFFGKYELGYYPNSRAYVSYYLTGTYYLINSEITDLETDDEILHISTGYNAYYYFSPKLRMNLNLEVNYDYNYYANSENTRYNRFNFGGSVGINYFIF